MLAIHWCYSIFLKSGMTKVSMDLPHPKMAIPGIPRAGLRIPIERDDAKNQCKRRFSRILKTLISHGKYYKNEGMGPLRGIRKVPKKPVENLLHFFMIFSTMLGALWAPKFNEKVHKT